MGGGYICALKILGPLKMMKVLLTSERVDADYENLLRLRPDLREPEPTTPMLLALFASVIVVMFGGRRLGKHL